MEQERVVVEMTQAEAEELARLRAEREEKAAAEKRSADREAYRQLSFELVDKYMPRIQELSEAMSELKTSVYRDFGELISTKGNLFAVPAGQRSHTFRSEDGSRRITLGYYVRDGWDELVDDGVQMVKSYLSSFADTPEKTQLVDIILDLLSKDKQGNLQAEKVLQLANYADKIDDPGFREGVRIIREGYRPEISKQFIRAEVKTSTGQWKGVPLSVTEVDIVSDVKNEAEPTSEQ